MKAEIFALLFAVISVIAAQAPDQKCKANESFKSCGTACEPSCENPKPEICTEQCVAACQCNDGFVRNSNGDCVRLSACSTLPTKCPANETFSDCHNPCTERKCPRRFAPQIQCIMMCQKGCGCNPGYARNVMGRCIKQSDCPKLPGYPDYLPTPPTASVATENPCNLVDCRSGLICELKNGEPTCVRPKRSVPEESITKPIGSCDTMSCSTPGGCAMVIPAGCSSLRCTPEPMCVNANPCHWTKCTAGKKCVLRQVTCIRAPCDPIAECVETNRPTRNATCPQNEEMVPCKNACSDKKCGQTEEMMCDMMCRGPGCACKNGFFRNSSGSCVSQQECDAQPNGRIRIRG